MIVLTIFCFLKFNRSVKRKEFQNQKSLNLQKNYSDIGFYQISIQNGDKINVFLKGGKHRLYLFIPYDPNILIQKIIIDGILVLQKKLILNGLSIEGNDNTTLEFSTKNSNQQIEANFWILPSNMCQKNSGYVFGTNSIEVHSDLDQLCIFSPSFDSKSSKFQIESGIPFIDGYHYSLVYTTDFEKPLYVNDGNNVETYTLKTANFVSFYSVKSNSDKDEFFTFTYKRRTKTKDVSYSQNYCVADSVYKCSIIGCSSSDVFNFVECLDYNIETIVIVGSVLGFVFAVSMLILIYCCMIKKKKNDGGLNEPLNTVPLNNENENYTQKDFNQNNYLNQNDYINPYDPSNTNNYQQY